MLSFLCRHDFYWSERHRSDRCRRCGSLRAGDGAEPARTNGLAALLAAGDGEGLETRFIPAPPPPRDPLFEDWDRLHAHQPVMPPEYVFEPAAPPEPEPQVRHQVEPEPQVQLEPTPAPTPTPVPSVRNGGGALLARIEHLASGGELTRSEAIDTVLAMIEDGQSSDPVLFGPNAALWYARLYAARQRAGSTVTD